MRIRKIHYSHDWISALLNCRSVGLPGLAVTEYFISKVMGERYTARLSLRLGCAHIVSQSAWGPPFGQKSFVLRRAWHKVFVLQ
jgi:hypothetical protein